MTSGVSATLAAVAQLMAYAAKADGRVSGDELEALQQFLAERYSDASRAEFFTQFREAVDHRPDVERIVSAIREALPSPKERLRVYAAIQTMLTASGGMSPEESDGLRKVASLLDIPAADADLLAAATKAAHDFQFPINRERFLRIGQDSSGFLDPRPLDLVAMDLGDTIAVASLGAGMSVGSSDPPAARGWPLTVSADAAFHYLIADPSVADADRVIDDLDGPLAVTIETSEDPEAPLLLRCLRYGGTTPLKLDGRPLESGSRVLLAAPAMLRVGHHVFAIDPRRLKVEYTQRV